MVRCLLLTLTRNSLTSHEIFDGSHPSDLYLSATASPARANDADCGAKGLLCARIDDSLVRLALHLPRRFGCVEGNGCFFRDPRQRVGSIIVVQIRESLLR